MNRWNRVNKSIFFLPLALLALPGHAHESSALHAHSEYGLVAFAALLLIGTLITGARNKRSK